MENEAKIAIDRPLRNKLMLMSCRSKEKSRAQESEECESIYRNKIGIFIRWNDDIRDGAFILYCSQNISSPVISSLLKRDEINVVDNDDDNDELSAHI